MKKLKVLLAMVLALAICLAFCACAKTTEQPQSDDISGEENSAQPTALGDPEKKAILVVSFGTSYNETRAVTIEAIENAITAEFTDFDVRRAFTSQIIIDKLASRDGLEIDNVAQALERLISEGYGTLVVQPTHIMNGYEYDEMLESIEPYKDSFVNLAVGQPLLSSDDDYTAVAEMLAAETAEYDADNSAVVFMGHGTEHAANSSYAQLQQKLLDLGYDNYVIGTVEAAPSLEDVMEKCEELGVSKVVLLPFMIVAGDHAYNDMAGDEEGSWKTEFKAAGYEVECVLRGVGEYEAAQKLFVEHTREVVESLG